MSIRVLADYHHSDLYESLELLFGRFGWYLFRPIGMEWFHEGYWQFEKVWHGDAVAKQYLELWGDDIDFGTCWLRKDWTHPGRVHGMLTIGQAREIKPHIVIASVPDNEAGLRRFAKEVGAKFGVQVGNNLQRVDWENADFGLISSTMPQTPTKPHVIYHQEFSLKDFCYTPPPRGDEFKIASFVQCFPENPRSYAEFLTYAKELNDMNWRAYGSYGTHPLDAFAGGNLPSTPAVAAAMRATDIVWHAKEWSDGFGHVIHNAFAVGRPVFGRAAYYADKLAGPLWLDGITSIDIGTRSREDVASWLRRIRDDEELHLRMSQAAAERFREIVNFDAEAEQIKAMLEKVL